MAAATNARENPATAPARLVRLPAVVGAAAGGLLRDRVRRGPGQPRAVPGAILQSPGRGGVLRSRHDRCRSRDRRPGRPGVPPVLHPGRADPGSDQRHLRWGDRDAHQRPNPHPRSSSPGASTGGVGRAWLAAQRPRPAAIPPTWPSRPATTISTWRCVNGPSWSRWTTNSRCWALMAQRAWTTVHLVWARVAPSSTPATPSRPAVSSKTPPPALRPPRSADTHAHWGLVELPTRITILQGADMGRPSRLLVDLSTDDDAVQLTGTAAPIPTDPTP